MGRERAGRGVRVVSLALAAMVALVAIWGASSWWTHAHRAALVKALEVVPGNSQRVSFTDWSLVIAEVGRSGGANGILSRAYDADLSSTSALVTSAEGLDTLHLPLSDIAWEAFAQSADGAVVVLDLGSDEAVQRWRGRLKSHGWNPMSGSGGGGMATLDGSEAGAELNMTPELAFVATRGSLLIGSDNPDYAEQVAAGDVPAIGAPMRAVADAMGDAVSAFVFTGDYTCGHLAMSQADDIDQAQARVLLKAAGPVDPMSAFAFGYVDDARHIRVAMDFDNSSVAADNADSRATLAAGDAPGQGGTFAERYRLGEVVSRDAVLTMEMRPLKGQQVVSDLSSGPVLWASC